MTIQEWLGADNELGIDIWERKYRYNNETFDEWIERVSGGNQHIAQLIREKKFLFGGRILANRGLDKLGKHISLSNCYVIAPPEDSIEDIFDAASKLARTFSYGGGCGIDISKLAPRGAKVNNAAKETTGAVSFMDLYSQITGLIGQSGRRGALMLSISCDHPDLEEFINIKSDLDKVTKANISIRITDKFMAAVKNKTPFTLQFIRQATREVITTEIDAYEFFHKICERNWDYAEPGMLFWDRIENWNLLSEDESFSYAGVNPCFDGSMRLLTTDGYKIFEELDGTEPYIYNVNGNIVKSKVWCSGEKPTIRLRVGNNDIICTPEHRFMTIDGDECQAKDLKGKQLMPCAIANPKLDQKFIKLGFIQGDGQLKRLNSKYHDGLEVNIGEKDTDIFDLFEDDSFTYQNEKTIYLSGYNHILKKLGFSQEVLPNRVFPTSYNEWTKIQKASFLQGCYSANGSVIKNGRISYKTTCKEFAEQLVDTLTNDFNIDGVYITTNKAHTVKFTNGEYNCRESYDVNIGRFTEIPKFISEINFYQQYKREQLTQMMKNKAPRVTNIEDAGIRKVYDFTEPERHWGIVEGVVVHNCAEEPLPAGGSCLLGSINLAEFVTENKTFDFHNFETVVKNAVIALNEVLDEGLPLHPLKEQRDSVRDWRQIGLGIMGLADMLIKMEVRYGSQEAVHICDMIGLSMAHTAILTSAQLAEQYGAYPKYHPEKILQSAYLTTHTTPKTLESVRLYGLHNSQLLTIAPTGSLSTMLQISGGIEPIFANYYERKTESLHGTDKYYKVYTKIVEDYMREHGLEDDAQLPEFFVTAQNLHYRERINMQSIWQKHIDASISSTVNVPNNFTVEQTKDLYMYAWEKNLKGVTIYRDGCKRSGILSTNTNQAENNQKEPSILPRGYIIKADDNCIGRKRTLHTGCGTLHCEAFFDPDTGDLLETYFSKGSQGGCNNFMIGLSRMISLAARGGVDIDSIVDQLRSSGTCPSYAVRTATKHDTSKGSSCPVAIGNALLEMHNEIMQDLFDEEDEEATSSMIDVPKSKPTSVSLSYTICPECGEKTVPAGGCVQCPNCGWSKCG